jgi:hypothetical protein
LNFSASSTDIATGTVVAFVKNTYYDGVDIVQSTTTATSTVLSDGSLADRFTHFVRTAVEKLTNVFVDMTLWVKSLRADKVETKELCIDDVCVTKDDLRQMLLNKNQNNSTNSSNQTSNNLIQPNTSTTTNSTTTENIIPPTETTTPATTTTSTDTNQNLDLNSLNTSNSELVPATETAATTN